MREFENKLRDYISENSIDAEHLSFNQSCHSVDEAAEAAGVSTDVFVKNICMTKEGRGLVVCIVKGEDRASTKRVAKALEIERPRLAEPEEILTMSGYPCGGTPSFGFDATFLIDPRVMEMDIVYTGGGSQQSLVKIVPAELVKANHGKVVRVRS